MTTTIELPKERAWALDDKYANEDAYRIEFIRRYPAMGDTFIPRDTYVTYVQQGSSSSFHGVRPNDYDMTDPKPVMEDKPPVEEGESHITKEYTCSICGKVVKGVVGFTSHKRFCERKQRGKPKLS